MKLPRDPVERRYRIERQDPKRGWVFACSLARTSLKDALDYAAEHFKQPVRLEPKR